MAEPTPPEYSRYPEAGMHYAPQYSDAYHEAPPPAYDELYKEQRPDEQDPSKDPHYVPRYQQRQFRPAAEPVLVQPVQSIHVDEDPVSGPRPPPHSYMMFSVLATLCCCWPIGLLAIMKSMEVSTARARGDMARAERSSKKAYYLARQAVLVGTFFFVIFAISTSVNAFNRIKEFYVAGS